MTDTPRLAAIITFLQRAEALKDTLRSGHTGQGRAESTAEHCWRLSLLALLLEDALEGVDLLHLLRLCIVHDLGEAVTGDVPAIHQHAAPDRVAEERAGMAHLCDALPADLSDRLMALWDEYADGATPAAAMAKGLDKIETMLQHAAGRNPPDFDYAFNLGYGRIWTDRAPLLRALRAEVDALTRARMVDQVSGNPRP